LDGLAGEARDIEDLYPLSPMQQGLLFHSLAAPQSGLYTTQVSCLLRDPDISALIESWKVAVQRHEVLRTAFVWAGLETPHQVVRSSCSLPVERLDWTMLPASERQVRLERYLEADRARGFDLGAAPLMRLVLIRMTQDEYRLVWSHHHALLDGWSVRDLMAEVVSAYDALIRHETPSLPERRPYRDYIAWLMTRQPDEAERFWRRVLGDLGPAPMPKIHSTTDGRQRFATYLHELPAVLDEDLKAFSRRSQLTLNTLVQGALALALRDSTDNSDLLFGSTVSGRPAELDGVESMIGVFLQALPVRIRIAPQVSTLAWLKQIQTEQAEARQFSAASLADILRWSNIPRGSLFDVLLVFRNLHSDALGSITSSAMEIDDLSAIGHSHYPLTITVIPAYPTRIEMEYDVATHTRTTVARLSAGMETALAAICAMAEKSTLRQLLRALARHTPTQPLTVRSGPAEFNPVPLQLLSVIKEVNRD
jgi:hypothetical protein